MIAFQYKDLHIISINYGEFEGVIVFFSE